MKYFPYTFFLACFFCMIPHTYAQTPVTEAQAKIYYSACTQKRDERMTEQTQATFCECSSLAYKTRMTQEDLQNLAQQDMRAREVMNKILIDLYAPCMEYPVRDMVFQKCTKDAFQAGKKICGCMASNMASYISKRAQEDLATILKDDPNIHDPLEAITSSPSYEQQEKRIVLQCIKDQYGE